MNLGREFMPPLDEGSLLFMRSFPDISNSEAKRLLQAGIKSLREFGSGSCPRKSGRANTATDNSPISMIETIILLKPANPNGARAKQKMISSMS